MVLSTVVAVATESEEPTMRNSNLLPVKAKGEVRLRSVASRRSSGTVEDPVTGTACGVMAAYYLAHMPSLHSGASSVSLLIEQGQDMGLDGKVQAWAEAQPDGIHVKIAGSAIPGQELSLII